MSTPFASALRRARAHSPFLALGLQRLPELAAILESGDGEAALGWAKAAGHGIGDVAIALRREKLALAVALGVGDLAGAFRLGRVVEELSALADRALDQAISSAILQRVPDAEPAGFTALALGKHGARELNYSSDIDPILLFDPASLPRRERDEPGEAAQRIARRVAELLGKMTGDGYVFRVDLRLRPASEVSPLAISFDAALSHYESSALAWERAAYIRARSCAGDIVRGEDFLTTIRPFIWRRSLDFGAIEEIARLTAQIRANYAGPLQPGPGFDVKRGRGGIREVEFFAQTHQLIHGGRNPALRQKGTRAALDHLADQGIIAAQDAVVLGESYDRLREIEHRLQMVEDRQTHSLPGNGAAMDNVAHLDGLADGAALIAELNQITDQVARRYDALLDQSSSGPVSVPVSSGAPLEGQLLALGFPNAGASARRIEGWGDGRVRSLRSEAARDAFDHVLPHLLDALAAAPDPERALIQWEALLVNLPSAINLFRLLQARPGLLEQLVEVLILAPPLAQELTRRPELLDTLIDATALDLPGDVDTLIGRMARRERGDLYEDRLDRIRRVVGETRFALGVQLIAGAHDPLEIGAALARTAEAALHVAADAAIEQFKQTHGQIEGDGLIVLGLGRLGGGMLTHASDLDVVYLFDGQGGAESDGQRPLGQTLYFNRLAQRVTAALSVPTAEGALYEVDTRLRPQGQQGPLAVNLAGFERYQHNDAWTWEHMALCRARPVYGNGRARAKLDAIIANVLRMERDPAMLRADILKMRSEIAAHKAPQGPLDVKLLRGGLVDLEFLVHYLQLRERAAFDPCVQKAITGLVNLNVLPPEVSVANDVLTRVLVAARLFADDAKMPPPSACQALATACRCDPAPAAILQMVGQARQTVARSWAQCFGTELELDYP